MSKKLGKILAENLPWQIRQSHKSNILNNAANTPILFDVLLSSNTKKIYLLTSIFVGLLVVLTMGFTSFFIMQYKNQYAKWEQNQLAVQQLLPSIAQNKKNIDTPGINVLELDQLMTGRQMGMSFDRIRLSDNTPLQVEGVATQQRDVGNLVEAAKYNGLPLEIKQVQADETGEVKFELRRAQS